MGQFFCCMIHYWHWGIQIPLASSNWSGWVCVGWAGSVTSFRCVCFRCCMCTIQMIHQLLILGQAKLIIRFPFPPACFLQISQNFHNYGNLHRMDFQIFTNFSLLRWWGFWYCFLKILVIMNNEKWPPARPHTILKTLKRESNIQLCLA